MPGSLTDNEIMLKVKNGDLDKMTILFERHHRALYGFLFHMTNHRESSEDLVQNVFYRMLKYRHTFNGNGEFKSWMFYLAINALKDNLKKDRRNRHEYDIAGISEKIGDGALVDEKIQKEQEINILLSAMKELPPADQEVLVLSQFQKLRYIEIAAIMNVTEGAVKVRVHRAFNLLKSIYLKTSSYGV